MVSTACGKHYNMRSRASETAEDSEAQQSQTQGGERRTAEMVEERDTWLVRHGNREQRG